MGEIAIRVEFIDCMPESVGRAHPDGLYFNWPHVPRQGDTVTIVDQGFTVIEVEWKPRTLPDGTFVVNKADVSIWLEKGTIGR